MKTRTTAKWLLATSVFIVALTVACNALSWSVPAGNGSLRLLVTDKPFPFEFVTSALVTLTKIEVRQVTTSQPAEDEGGVVEKSIARGQPNAQSNANENDNDVEDAGQDDAAEPEGDDDGDGGFVTIFEGEKSFDLLELRNGKTDLLADTTVPAGMYDQMRLFVTQGEITLTDGRVFPLKVPSGESSGIKLNFEFEVSGEGDQTVLLLDVDLSRAFQATPSGHIDNVDTIREFKFHPAFAMRLINLLEAGSVSGVVTDATTTKPVAGASVTAFDGTDEVTTTSTDANGVYMLMGLPTGTYQVHFEAVGYNSTDVNDVVVQAGEDTPNVNAALTPLPAP